MGKTNDITLCIPFEKGWVRGYYEKRNGRLVWIKPYENSKVRKMDGGNSDVQNLVETAGMPIKQPPKSSGGTTGIKPIDNAQISKESMNFLLHAIIACVKTIRSFKDGEIVKVAPALLIARSIIKELGYYDRTMENNFEIPDTKPTKLGSGASRETEAMAKQLNRLSRRVTKSTLREKVQKMSSQLEEAL